MSIITPRRTPRRPGRLRLSVDLPEHMHDKLRVRAARDRTTMTGIVTAAVERVLADEPVNRQ